MTWAVVAVRTTAEMAICENLKRDGFETYLPRYREQVLDPRTGRLRLATFALFPSYVFVWFQSAWRGILEVLDSNQQVYMRRPDVRYVVCDDDTPCVADRAVAELRSRENSKGFVVLPKNRDQRVIGSPVRVLSGAFAGQVGFYGGRSGRGCDMVDFGALGRVTLARGDKIA